MQITNDAADIINEYILSSDSWETISSIEDAVQLNKEFDNKFDINAYYHPYRKYNDELNNWDIYCLWETLYESIILWWFNYFKEQLWWFNRHLTYWYYDYLYRYDKWQLQEVFNMLSEEEQLKLYNDPICKYYIHKFSLDLKF